MKKSANILLIGGIILIGGVFTFATLFTGTPKPQSSEFTPEEAKAAADMNVSQPPEPFTPAGTDRSGAQSDTVTAVKPKIATGSVKFTCTGEKSTDFSCYEDFYTNLIKSKPKIADGISAAFADLKARYPDSSYVQSQCHPLTHVIGRVAAQSFTKVSQAYNYGDSYCWSGYYHGVLETFAGRVGLKNLAANINDICADLNADGRYSFDYYNCVHGMGHGLMAITDDELFKSLNYCDAMKGDWEQQSCASGVYMENVIVDGLNHVTNYLDPKRPLYPCSDSPDKYKNTCYLMQTSYMLKVNGSDFAKTFQWCRDAGAYQATCDQSLGRDASGRTVSNGPRAKAICDLGQTQDEKTNCVIGAVKDFISYFHSDTQAKDFCNLYDDPIKKTCLDTTSSYYQSF